jgi:hypothetical protein
VELPKKVFTNPAGAYDCREVEGYSLR